MYVTWMLVAALGFFALRMVYQRFPKELTQKEIETKMGAFFEKRLPLGFPITREEIIQNVFGGWDVPMMVKDDGHFVYVRTEVFHNGWSALVFTDGKLDRGLTPSEIEEKCDAFRARKLLETPLIKTKLLEQVFNGVSVDEAGDLSWWPDLDHSYVLATATLSDGKHVVVGYEDGVFLLLSSTKGNYQMVLDNLSRRPMLELDDDHINIHFAKDRQILAWHNSTDRQELRRGWDVGGFGWSGTLACQKFAEHGMSCSADGE